MIKETFSQEEIDWLNDYEYKQNIIDYCFDINDSNLEEDLLRNTRTHQCYYYT